MAFEIRAIIQDGRLKSGKQKIDKKALKRVAQTARTFEMHDMSSPGGHSGSTEHNPQAVQTQMNPMFTRLAAQATPGVLSAAAASSMMNHQEVMAMTELPSPEAWMVVRQSYSDLVEQVRELTEQVTALKRAQQSQQRVRRTSIVDRGVLRGNSAHRPARTKRRTFAAPPQHILEARQQLEAEAEAEAEAGGQGGERRETSTESKAAPPGTPDMV